MNNNTFNKFAIDDDLFPTHNSYKLTADGCMQRYSDKKKYTLSDKESEIRGFSQRWNNSEFAETDILCSISYLANKGIVDLKPEESVEHFITRHENELSTYLRDKMKIGV